MPLPSSVIFDDEDKTTSLPPSAQFDVPPVEPQTPEEPSWINKPVIPSSLFEKAIDYATPFGLGKTVYNAIAKEPLPGAQGFTKGLAEVGSGLTTPLNAALTAGTMGIGAVGAIPTALKVALPKVLAGYFGAKAAPEILHGGQQTYQDVQQGDIEGAAQHGVQTLANAAMTALGAKEVLGIPKAISATRLNEQIQNIPPPISQKETQIPTTLGEPTTTPVPQISEVLKGVEKPLIQQTVNTLPKSLISPEIEKAPVSALLPPNELLTTSTAPDALKPPSIPPQLEAKTVIQGPIDPDLTIQERNRLAYDTAVKHAEERIEEFKNSGTKRSKNDWEFLKKNLVKKYYLKARKEAGIEGDETLVKRAGLVEASKVKNETAAANDIERTLGVEQGGHTQRLVDAQYQTTHALKNLDQIYDFQKAQKRFKKLGVPSKEVNRLIEYVRADKGQPRWDPTEFTRKTKSGNTETIPAYTGAPPSPQVMQELYGLRQALDQMHTIAGEQGEFGYHPRYNPRVPLIPEIIGRSGDTTNPVFKRQRSGKEGPLQTDFFKKMEGYKRQLVNEKYLGPLEAENTKIVTQLKMLGKEGLANRAEETMARARGFTSKEKYAELKIDDILKMNTEQLGKLRAELKLDPTTFEKVLREMHNQMYHSFLGLNPWNWFANFVQPEITGAPEVGFLNTEIARLKRVKLSASDQEAVNAVRDRLRGEHYDPNELSEKPAVNVAAKAARAAGVFGMKGLDWIDQIGRETVFLAARRKYLKASDPSKAVGNLIESEKQIVRDALKTKGREAAAREYGVITSQRAMHRYSNVDKAKFFREGVGEYIPFTTFARGEAGKLYEDARQKNYKNIAKRLTYPLLMFGVAAAFADKGDEMKRALYMYAPASIPKLLSVGVTPALGGGALDTAEQYGPEAGVKAAAKLFATPNLILKLTKEDKKRGGGNLKGLR